VTGFNISDGLCVTEVGYLYQVQRLFSIKLNKGPYVWWNGSNGGGCCNLFQGTVLNNGMELKKIMRILS
jgi:hypothetical protein